MTNAKIDIKDEDALSVDDLIGSVVSDSSGGFSFSWTAIPMDPFDNIVEVYAVFEGDVSYANSRSQQINIEVY